MTKLRICAALALAGSLGLAHADSLPEVHEGLWQIDMQSIDNPGNKKSTVSYKLCRDHAYDKAGQALAKNIKGCGPLNATYGGGNMSSEMRCTVGGTVIESKGTGTYSTTASHTETHATYTPAFYGNTDEMMTQDQKYLGSCPAGMQPGDRMLPDGTIQHRRS